MTLMAEEDSSVDMNVVVVAQTLRLFCVVVSVPFLAMQMIDETSAAVALEKPDEWHRLALIPICFVGRFIGKKLHLPTKQLLGPILATALFATLIHPLGKAPHELMSIAQLNIGLYIGTKLEKDRLLALRPMIPNLLLNLRLLADNGVLGDVAWRDNGNVYGGVGDGRERAADFGVSAVQVADDKFCVAVRDKVDSHGEESPDETF